MLLNALLVGLIAGVTASIPVAGPVAVLILRTALQGRWRDAFLIAIGSAVAETTYSALAFLGVAALFLRFPTLATGARVVSACVLLAVGGYLILKRVDANVPSASGERQKRSPLVGFMLTALNPTLIISWTTVIATLHAYEVLPARPIAALPFALGVASGIVGWFSFFLWLLRHFRQRVATATVDKIVLVMGWALLVGGVISGVRTGVQLLR